jgi:hypothetical protein
VDNQPGLTLQVNAVLERYGADEVMLDALLQWALNPTSMSAGYALQENSPYILDNLRLRHGLSADEARRIVTTLDATCGELVRQATGLVRDSRYAVSEVRQSLREKLTQGRVAPILRQGVLRRLKAVSEDTRRAQAMFNLIGKLNPLFTPDSVTRPPDRWNTAQSEFQAYHAATFRGSLPLVRVFEEAVHAGVYNRLLWISSGKSADRVTLEPAIVPTTQELAALGTEVPPAPDADSLLESLWKEERYPLLRLIDVASHSPNGVVNWDEPWPVGGADIPGFVGTHGNTVALSPLLFQQTREALSFSKQQRLESPRRTVENALETLERKYGLDSSVLVLLAAEGETLWQVLVTSHPSLYVYLTPWLTPRTVDRLGFALAARGYEKQSHALLVVPYQSRPLLQVALEKIEEKDRRLSPEGVSLSALGDKLEAVELRIIRGRSHPLLDELFGVQKGRGGERKKEQEVKELLVDLRIVPPVSVLVGQKVTAMVQARDDHNNPVEGAEILISWSAAESKAVTDDKGSCFAAHQYNNAGTYQVAVAASKDGFSIGRADAQVTVSKKPEDVAPAPYRITFPPFADGSSLVFGRGPLHGKLALGFRADSSFAEDNVVACDLTNVNSGHIGIFMQIRGGKSTLSASLILQAAFQGIPVVVIDPKPDYTSCLLPLDVGGRVASGFLQGAQRRFQLSQQDQRGFDLSKDLEFTDAETSYRLRFQVVTFNRERASLPGTRSYRAPLVVLPDAADPLLAEQCDGLANALAGQLMAKPEEKGYNALLARTLETIKHNNSTQQYALIDHVIAALQTVEASEFGKRDVDRVTSRLRKNGV